MTDPEQQPPPQEGPAAPQAHESKPDAESSGVPDDGADDTPPELLGPTSRRWGTVGLVLLNLAVGVVMAWAGVSVLYAAPADVIAFGAVEPTRLWSGEVWRLLVACFVHVGCWHLGLNVWVLWQVGRALERLVGTPRLVLIYVASGIFGFALSVALMPGLTAGASGAVFGVTGALLAIATLTRQRALGRFLLTSFVPFVVATFALGVLLPMVNNVAHFGGLLMGFLLTWGLSAGDRSFVGADAATTAAIAAVTVSARERRLGVFALALSVVGFALVSAYAVDPRWSPRFHAMMGLRALHAAGMQQPSRSAQPNNVDDDPLSSARIHSARATALAPDDPATLLLAARVLEHDGKDDEAGAAAAAAFVGFQRGGDRQAGFDNAVRELGLSEPDDDDPGQMDITDGFSVRTLCGAALEELKGPAPVLKNTCAWLLLRAREPAVQDPQRALPLAKEAFDESGKHEAAIAHTYATALGQNNAAAEGLAILERLQVQGDDEGFDRAFLTAERGRLQKLADEQRRDAPVARPDDVGAVDVRPSAESR